MDEIAQALLPVKDDDLWSDLLDITQQKDCVSPTSFNFHTQQEEEIQEFKLLDVFDYNCCGRKCQVMNPKSMVDFLINGESDIEMSENDYDIKMKYLQKDKDWDLQQKNDEKLFKYQNNQKLHIFHIPDDCVVMIFNFLELRDLICVGQVCKYWKHIHRDDILWEPFLEWRFGTLEYDAKMEKELLYQLRQKRGEKNDEQLEKQRLKSYKKKKKKKVKKRKHRRDKKVRKRLEKRERFYKYWTIFKRRMKIIEEEKRWSIKEKKRVQILQHYKNIFKRPKIWIDIIHYSFWIISMVILFVLSCMLLMWNVNDNVPYVNFVPVDLFSNENKRKITFLITCIPIFLYLIFYVFSFICAVGSSFINALVHYDRIGFFLIPAFVVFYVVKLFLLPEYFAWGVSMAPLYVIFALVFIVACFIQWKFDFIEWKKKQKVVYGLCFLFNALGLLSIALRSIHADNTFKVKHPYIQVIFIPIWLFNVIVCIAIPVVGKVVNKWYGWKITTFVYSPIASSLLLLCVFSILYSLVLEDFLKTSEIMSWIITFIPLLLWEILWFILLIFLLVVKTIKNIKNASSPTDYLY